MELKHRHKLVASLLATAWLVLVVWQVQEHQRVGEAAKSNLRNRAREIASTLSAVTRALRFRGAIFQERLEPVLNELVKTRTNSFVNSSGLLAISLLNTEGHSVVSVGDTNLANGENLADRESWYSTHVRFVLPLEGASVSPEGASNSATVVIPPFRIGTNDPARSRDFFRRPPRPDDTNGWAWPPTNGPMTPTNSAGEITAPGPPPPDDHPHGGPHRPPWMRGVTDAEFKALTAKRELHGLVLAMSTDQYRTASTSDLWLRGIIVFFAGLSALGTALAWRNLGRTAELQIRLVRASELNSHLKAMNLAAAGLAHETRNPLNLIRGQAQMIARLPDASPAAREKAQIIVDETDKVTAELTEFINYSRPREVRRTRVALTQACREIVRTLSCDFEEKQLAAEISGEALVAEADEQLLRQVLFNLLINATQAVGTGGRIQIEVRREGPGEAVLEVRDDGPGVPPEIRSEIFKPYFTTHQNGSGLGLAVVRQIALAHGWEIACLPNAPRGAIFRLTGLKRVG